MPTPATPSPARRLAEAARAALEAASGAGLFASEVTVTRKAVVNRKLRDVLTRQVAVVPASWEKDLTCRNQAWPDVRASYDLAVQAKVDPDDTDTVDTEDDLLNQLADYLFSDVPTLTDSEGDAWEPLEMKTLPGAEAGHAWAHLLEHRVYTGVVRIKYQQV